MVMLEQELGPSEQEIRALRHYRQNWERLTEKGKRDAERRYLWALVLGPPLLSLLVFLGQWLIEGQGPLLQDLAAHWWRLLYVPALVWCSQALPQSQPSSPHPSP